MAWPSRPPAAADDQRLTQFYGLPDGMTPESCALDMMIIEDEPGVSDEGVEVPVLLRMKDLLIACERVYRTRPPQWSLVYYTGRRQATDTHATAYATLVSCLSSASKRGVMKTTVPFLGSFDADAHCVRMSDGCHVRARQIGAED